MKKAMNSTITDQRYQIEKATCAVTFDQIRLRRAITSFPARHATSSLNPNPLGDAYAPRGDCLSWTISPSPSNRPRAYRTESRWLNWHSAAANRNSLELLVFPLAVGRGCRYGADGQRGG